MTLFKLAGWRGELEIKLDELLDECTFCVEAVECRFSALSCWGEYAASDEFVPNSFYGNVLYVLATNDVGEAVVKFLIVKKEVNDAYYRAVTEDATKITKLHFTIVINYILLIFFVYFFKVFPTVAK